MLGAVLIDRQPQAEAHLRKRPIVVIAVGVVRRSVIRHDQIRPPVVIEIGPHHAETVIAVRVIDLRFLRDVGKSPIAIIVVERIARPWQSTRAALYRYAAILALRAFAELRE